MSVLIFNFLSVIAAEDTSCSQCFGGKTTMTVAELLASEKYYDPATNTCGDQKNDQQENLIFDKDNSQVVPKNWILNPEHCGAANVEDSIDLAIAEEAWILSQLAYASSNQPYYMDLNACIDQRYSQIGKSADYQPSQAKVDQFASFSNVKFVERPVDFECASQQNSSKKVKAGPSGAFWADQGNDFVFAWRGTAVNSQLKDEIENIAVEYLKPLGQSFVTANITTPDGETINVGGVFDYFYSIFMDLWQDSDFEDLKTRVKAAADAGKTIKLVGHSLGGALASIAAMYLVVELGVPGDKIQFITFGEPRLSDSTFSVNQNTLVRNQVRYVYSRDLVPHVPPMKDINGLFGTHIRSPQGGQSAFHHSQEVFLQEDFWKSGSANFGKYHACGYDDMENAQSEDCSNAVTNLGSLTDLAHLFETITNDKQAVWDHTHYWPQWHDICAAETSTTAAPSSSVIV